MPHVCQCIVDGYHGVDLSNEQELDKEFLWNLRILSDVRIWNIVKEGPYESLGQKLDFMGGANGLLPMI